MERKPKRKIGRPRTVPEDAQKFSISLRALTKRRLTAMAKVEGCTGYEIIERALQAAWKAMPEEKRFAAETLARALEQAEQASQESRPKPLEEPKPKPESREEPAEAPAAPERASVWRRVRG